MSLLDIMSLVRNSMHMAVRQQLQELQEEIDISIFQQDKSSTLPHHESKDKGNKTRSPQNHILNSRQASVQPELAKSYTHPHRARIHISDNKGRFGVKKREVREGCPIIHTALCYTSLYFRTVVTLSAYLLDMLDAVDVLVGEDAAVNGEHLSEQVENVLWGQHQYHSFSGGTSQGPYLGHSLVVDRDQILGLRVDLEGSVEAKRSLDGAVGTLNTRCVSTLSPPPPPAQAYLRHTASRHGRPRS